MTQRFLTNLFCLSLLVVSAFATVVAYQRLQEEIESNKGLLPTIEMGESSYSLLLDGKCFGLAHSTLTQDDGYDLEMNARLLLAVNAKPVPVSLKFVGGFNSLGQSGGILLQVRLDGKLIAFGLQGINPMKLQVKGIVAERSFNFEREIPGPVILRERPDGTFVLEHRGAGAMVPQQSSPISQSVLQSLRPKVVHESDPQNPRCQEESLEPLEVGQYLKLGQTLFQTLQILQGP